jgi:hypothetical protein
MPLPERAAPLPVARIPDNNPPAAADPPPSPPPPIQRTTEAPATPIVASPPADVPAVQRDPAPAAAPPETDELVRQLFDPLLRRLKTELRLDRERRGALTDRPH